MGSGLVRRHDDRELSGRTGYAASSRELICRCSNRRSDDGRNDTAGHSPLISHVGGLSCHRTLPGFKHVPADAVGALGISFEGGGGLRSSSFFLFLLPSLGFVFDNVIRHPNSGDQSSVFRLYIYVPKVSRTA